MGRPTAEQLFRPFLRAAPITKANSSPTQFAGRTAVASGTGTATVSTTAVKSDSLIQVSFYSNVASNVAQVIKTCSLVDGSYFGMTVTPAPVGTDFLIVWQIWNQQ
jgi:hypothetical protein